MTALACRCPVLGPCIGSVPGSAGAEGTGPWTDIKPAFQLSRRHLGLHSWKALRHTE